MGFTWCQCTRVRQEEASLKVLTHFLRRTGYASSDVSGFIRVIRIACKEDKLWLIINSSSKSLKSPLSKMKASIDLCLLRILYIWRRTTAVQNFNGKSWTWSNVAEWLSEISKSVALMMDVKEGLTKSRCVFAFRIEIQCSTLSDKAQASKVMYYRGGT